MPRTQKIHQEEEINKAVALYKEGLSMRKIANELCIPKSTVYDHVKGKFSGYNTSFGREPSLSYDEEVSVVNYSVYMAERGLPLNRQNLRILMKEILLRRPRPTSINLEKGPSDKFITKFLKRHKDSISIRSSHPLESNRATISQGQIDHFYQLLQDMMSKLDPNDKPSRMYNMDESGFSGRLTSSKKVIVPKGTRHAYQTQVTMSGHVTVVQAISAGGESCPPMIIFSGCLPRGTYEAGVPDKFIFRSTDSGFINNALFLEWFEEAFKPSLGKERPVLLLLDNHVSHCHPQFIDKAKHHGVDLLYFPSHASHLLQPLDVVYFHILKQKFADLAIKIGYMGCKTLPRNLFPRLLHQAYSNITGSTIASSFSDPGIYPFNNKAVVALNSQKQSKPLSADKENPTIETCETCGHSKENYLVKLGLVSKELSEILVEPPPPPKKKGRKNTRSHEMAEAVYSKPVETEVPTEPEQDMEEAQPTAVPCEVCMTDYDIFWVGCDNCDRWYHHECLSPAARRAVDKSLSDKSVWLCHICSEE